MTFDDALHDVTIRRRQLEEHILTSPEYRFRADQDIKRQVSMLYLAIALLLLFQGLFAIHQADQLPFAVSLLIALTSILAIGNCLLLIRTKKCLHRLNEAWLNPEAREALDTLRHQRDKILLTPRAKDGPGNAELN